MVRKVSLSDLNKMSVKQLYAREDRLQKEKGSFYFDLLRLEKKEFNKKKQSKRYKALRKRFDDIMDEINKTQGARGKKEGWIR